MFRLSGDYNAGEPHDFEPVLKAAEKYRKYLVDNKHAFPESAFNFAVAAWRDSRDHSQGLADSWLESLCVNELSKGERSEIRWTEIVIKLLGAYHDGTAVISYKNVKSYTLGLVDCEEGHCSFLIDEIRLSKNDKVIHELEWVGRERWLIECEDINYEWKPFK